MDHMNTGLVCCSDPHCSLREIVTERSGWKRKIVLMCNLTRTEDFTGRRHSGSMISNRLERIFSVKNSINIRLERMFCVSFLFGRLFTQMNGH